MLEKKKASQDYKKYSDKCEKQKNEIKSLQEEKTKVNAMIAKGKEKDAETKQLREQIDRLKKEFEVQVAQKMGSQEFENGKNSTNASEFSKKVAEEKDAEISQLKESISQYKKQVSE